MLQIDFVFLKLNTSCSEFAHSLITTLLQLDIRLCILFPMSSLRLGKGEEGKSRHFTFRFISKELIVVKDSLRYHLKVLFITIIFRFTRFLNVNPF